MTAYYDILQSPLGDIVLTSNGHALTGLRLGGRPPEECERDVTLLRPFVQQVIEYLAGERTSFSFPVAQPGTDFHQKVWSTLMTIPYGETISYGELAVRIGYPNAYRAVGTANGRNQIAIVVPCHRVIAAGGKLGGYGGELWRKEWLLTLEKSL
jgi:methylated-DNA-[protein]-cysteine S-methyltransferase